jgi:hypothetical protein
MKRKSLSMFMSALSVLALVLLLSASVHHVKASGEYYYDFDSSGLPPTPWDAGTDSLLLHESAITSSANLCPENGTHSDSSKWMHSDYANPAVWLVKSFPGDSGDTVTVSWSIQDDHTAGFGCSSLIPCLTGYYVGTSAPTAGTQFTVVDYLIEDDQWHAYPPPGDRYSVGTSGTTIYVAFMWKPQLGIKQEGKMDFDCLDVKIEANSR